MQLSTKPLFFIFMHLKTPFLKSKEFFVCVFGRLHGCSVEFTRSWAYDLKNLDQVFSDLQMWKAENADHFRSSSYCSHSSFSTNISLIYKEYMGWTVVHKLTWLIDTAKNLVNLEATKVCFPIISQLCFLFLQYSMLWQFLSSILNATTQSALGHVLIRQGPSFHYW